MGLLCRDGQLAQRRLHDLTDLRSDRAKRHPETTTELTSPVLCQAVCALRLPRFGSANRPACALDVLRELSPPPRRQMKHVRSKESPESMAKEMLNYHV